MKTRFSEFQSKYKLVYGVAGGVFCISCSPHLFPKLLIKESDSGIPVPVELQSHVEKIGHAMNIAKPNRIKVFINNGLSSVSAGNTLLPGGAVIGLSRLVLANNTDDVLDSGLILKGNPVLIGNERSHRIADLLLPTINQTNFSIGHELAHIQHLDFLQRSALAPVALVTLYHASCLIPPFIYPSNPFAVVPMIFAVGLLIYAQLHFTICQWQEYKADRRSAINHISYTQGGIEMMTKRLKLDELLSSPVVSNQEVNNRFKTHPPIKDRLQRLQDLYFKQQTFS